jgi:hypothetical protein
LKVGLEDRLKNELERTLNHPVTDRGNQKTAATATGLGYHHFPQPMGSICPLDQLLMELIDKPLYAVTLDILK